MSLLYKGDLVLGKWKREEEALALQIMREFLRGECHDCEKGTLFDTYLAFRLNTTIYRVHNKFMDKPILNVSHYLQLSR